MDKPQRDIYLVVGGSGFLGRHIVEALVSRGDDVSVFDIVQRHHDVPFYTGDLAEQGSVEQAIQKSGATCIIHTASPPHGIKDDALYWRVNVDGTQSIIDAAIARGVKKLVFTSSAGVVFNGNDIINVDERLPYPEKAWDAYNESKAKAEELVLKANGQGGLLTVALRPAGIFGPGDRQAMAGFYDVYRRGQTHFQIGENNNLFDWTYVSNVVDAHLLAADKLIPVAEDLTPEALRERQQQIIDYPLPGVSATTGGQRVPTSEARPLGPYVDPPPNGEQIEAAFRAPYDVRKSNRPVRRSRFDPLSDNALAKAEHDPLTVAGNVFFITNGEPIYFWDLPRMVWARLAELDGRKDPPRGIWKIPKDLGFVLATMAEWWGWVVGKEPAFTRFRVTFSCVCRWHNIERARRVLGYEPKVGVEEGAKRMIDWWHAEHGKSQ